MQNKILKLISDKDYSGIRKILSSNPELANEGIPLNNDPEAKKGHPLHRICDAVFENKISDEQAIEIAKIFLACGANINGYQSLGDNNTPLIAAASLHAENLGIFYIDQGADIFYADKSHGATALHWASYCGQNKLVQKLILQGAKINQRDNSFDGTPLDWAIHILRSSDGNNLFHQRECINLLINAGGELRSGDSEYLHSIKFFE